MNAVRALTCFSGVAFLVYGVLCFVSPSMGSDFHRFGMDRLRILTGVLEVLGGAGLLIGLAWRPAVGISSAGLALLMLAAFATRMHMRDRLAVSLPSFLFLLVNLYIVVRTYQPGRLAPDDRRTVRGSS